MKKPKGQAQYLSTWDTQPAYAILADGTGAATAAAAVVTALQARTVGNASGDTQPAYAILADGAGATTAAAAVIAAFLARTVGDAAADAQATHACLAQPAYVATTATIVCVRQKIDTAAGTNHESRFAVPDAIYIQ